MAGYQQVEEERLEWKLERVEAGLESIVTENKRILKDWATWDSTYKYIEERNPDFIEENMIVSLYKDINLTMVMIFDMDNQLVFGQAYNPSNDQLGPIDEATAKAFSQYHNQSGLIYYNESAYYYSSAGVTNSQGTTPVNGYIVFVNQFDQASVNALSEEIIEDITILDYYDDSMANYKTTTIEEKDQYYATYNIPYKNRPASVLFKIDVNHDITDLGATTVLKALLLYVISFVIISMILYLVVKRYVYQISRFTKDINDIKNSTDLTRRIRTVNKGELGTLATTVNDMLNHIEHMHKRLSNYASFDVLTGILNRRGGFEKLDYYMSQAKDKHLPLTIGFVDINDLKKVNDLFGHNHGDDYLKTMARLLEDNLRDTDVICRLGGDEFLIIYPNCSEDDARSTLDRIVDKINAENQKDYPYHLSMSVGLEAYNYTDDIKHFVEKADVKMYANKSIFKEEKRLVY